MISLSHRTLGHPTVCPRLFVKSRLSAAVITVLAVVELEFFVSLTIPGIS